MVRKLVAYVEDEDIELLEKNGILGYGRNSQFSSWLRKTIHESFGMKNPLKIEEIILQEKEKIATLEKQSNDIKDKILDSTNKVNELSKKLLDVKKKQEDKKNVYMIFNKQEINFIKNTQTNNDLEAYRQFLKQFNNPNAKFSEFKKLKESFNDL